MLLIYVYDTELCADLFPGFDVLVAFESYGLISLDAVLFLCELVLGFFDYELDVFSVDEYDAVFIAYSEVSGKNRGSAAAYGEVDLSGAVLIRSLRGDALAVDGERCVLECVEVSESSVYDPAADALECAVSHHHFARERSVDAAAGVDNENVSGLRYVHCSVEHCVVSGGSLDGDAGSAERTAVGDALKMSGVEETVHHVVDVG